MATRHLIIIYVALLVIGLFVGFNHVRSNANHKTLQGFTIVLPPEDVAVMLAETFAKYPLILNINNELCTLKVAIKNEPEVPLFQDNPDFK